MDYLKYSITVTVKKWHSIVITLKSHNRYQQSIADPRFYFLLNGLETKKKELDNQFCTHNQGHWNYLCMNHGKWPNELHSLSIIAHPMKDGRLLLSPVVPSRLSYGIYCSLFGFWETMKQQCTRSKMFHFSQSNETILFPSEEFMPWKDQIHFCLMEMFTSKELIVWSKFNLLM